MNFGSTWIINQLALLGFCNLKQFYSHSYSRLFEQSSPSIFTSLVFSSQIQQLSRFYSQHSKLHLSVNLFVYSFIQWFHCGKLVSIYTLNTLWMIIWCYIVLICPSAQLAQAFQLTKTYFTKMFCLFTVIV